MKVWALALLVLTATAPADGPIRSAVLASMAASAAGWSDGSLDRFVAIYADDALYATKTGPITGKARIAAHYRASFAGGTNRRGQLRFTPLAWRAIDPRHELLMARWTLTPGRGRPVETGMTTLLFEQRGDRWLIVADHSS